jgi:hypothetical protein
MNSKNIDFIKCTDKKRKKFEVYDGSKWIKYDSEKFENIVLCLIGYINKSILNGLTNTSDLDILEFKKLYGVPKEQYHDCETGTKQQIISATFNPIYDTNLNYIKTIKKLCAEMFDIESKSKKSKSKKSRYDDDSSDDSDDSDDSDSDEDD